MATCDCGAVTNRMQQAFDPKGNGLGWHCPECHPEEFSDDPFLAPADRKVWDGLAAEPHRYYQRPDGSYEAKDELKADIQKEIMKPRDWAEQEQIEAKKEEKRKNRRTRPMAKWEIEQLERAWTENRQ